MLSWNLVLTVLYGLIFGSFGTVLTSRLSRNESIVSPASRCRACDQELAWFENLPVISFIALRGRCRYCRTQIPLFYPVTEILTSVLFVAVYLVAGLTPAGLALAALAVVTPPLIIIDVQQKRLPNGLTYSLFIYCLLMTGMEFFMNGSDQAKDAFIVSAALGTAFFTLRFVSSGGMGLGDVKLVCGLGLALGLTSWKTAVTGIIIGFFLGAIYAIPSAVKRDLKRAIPFGPFLLIGAWIAVLGGTTLNSLILGLWGIK